MKKSWRLISCMVVVVVLALGAAGCSFIPEWEGDQGAISVPQQQSTGIWVTGQGEVMAVPDVAELRLGVEARADTVSEAQAQASEAMTQVMQALQDNGVAEEDIQTQRFNIYPVTRWIEEKEEEETLGYRVSNMVVVKIREIDRTGDIIDVVAQAAGDLVRIQGISFSIDDPSKYYEEARAKAVEDAKGKASQLANLADVKLGEPTYISEGAIYEPPVIRGNYEAGGFPVPAPAPTPPISPGELKITVNIQIVYSIV